MKGKVLVTGAAGFIGSHLVEKLTGLDYEVIGLDNFDDYYSPAIKRDNIRSIDTGNSFHLIEGDIRDNALVARIFSENRFDMVAHLAARAGVRPSIREPRLYEEVNVLGTINLLEAARTAGIKKFVFTSSSSVYGLNGQSPFSEDVNVNCPMSPYAASKASAELFCRTYNYLYDLPVVVVRPFTVYGPRQRPEMVIHLFVDKIERGEEVTVFGDGNSSRDYTYVADIVAGIEGALAYPGKDFQILNLGAGRGVKLGYLLSVIENILGKKARVNYIDMPPGDVPATLADISRANRLIGYQPQVSIEEGVANFVNWYKAKEEVKL